MLTSLLYTYLKLPHLLIHPKAAHDAMHTLALHRTNVYVVPTNSITVSNTDSVDTTTYPDVVAYISLGVLHNTIPTTLYSHTVCSSATMYAVYNTVAMSMRMYTLLMCIRSMHRCKASSSILYSMTCCSGVLPEHDTLYALVYLRYTSRV